MVMFGTKGTVQSKTQAVETIQPTLSKPREVQDAASLLKPHRHQLQLERIQELAHVPEYYYRHFYTPAILQVAEFVQLLPAARVIKFNKAGGLLDFSLRRTSETLAWYRREYPVRQKDPEKVTLEDAQMTWALFSAALILGLGYIPTQYWVSLCQEDGTYLARWQPFLGSMVGQGQWYRCGIEPAFDNLAHRSTLLLAEMLLPKEALAWLSSHKDLFNAWLALLAGDLTDGGLLAKFVMPAEWQLLEHARPTFEGEMLPSLSPSLDELIKPELEATPAEVEAVAATTGLQTETAPLTQHLSISTLTALKAEELSGAAGAMETGQAFLEWLRYAIEGQGKRADGTMRIPKLPVNAEKAMVHMSKDGVHLNLKGLADAFGAKAAQIAAGLTALGVSFRNATGGNIVVADPNVIFMNKIPGPSAYIQPLPLAAYPPITSNVEATMTVNNAPQPK